MSFSTIAANVARLWSQYSGVYFQGLLGTLGLAAITVLFGTVLGTVTAICRLSGFRPGQALARFYVWIIRGTPVLLQLYFFWLLLPRAAAAGDRRDRERRRGADHQRRGPSSRRSSGRGCRPSTPARPRPPSAWG